MCRSIVVSGWAAAEGGVKRIGRTEGSVRRKCMV